MAPEVDHPSCLTGGDANDTQPGDGRARTPNPTPTLYTDSVLGARLLHDVPSLFPGGKPPKVWKQKLEGQ